MKKMSGNHLTKKDGQVVQGLATTSLEFIGETAAGSTMLTNSNVAKWRQVMNYASLLKTICFCARAVFITEQVILETENVKNIHNFASLQFLSSTNYTNSDLHSA